MSVFRKLLRAFIIIYYKATNGHKSQKYLRNDAELSEKLPILAAPQQFVAPLQ